MNMNMNMMVAVGDWKWSLDLLCCDVLVDSVSHG